MSGKIVLGWHQVTSQDGNNTFDSIVAKTKGMNVISPTWFSLTDNNGNYRSLGEQTIMWRRPYAKGLQVWGADRQLQCRCPDGDAVSIHLHPPQADRQPIMDAEKYDLDGLNLDFESLKTEAGVHYIEFIRELSIPCRQKGIVLSVDNYVPADTTASIT